MCFLSFQSEWTIHVYFRLLTKVQPTQVVPLRTTRNHGVHMTALFNLLGGSTVHQGQVRRFNRLLILEKNIWNNRYISWLNWSWHFKRSQRGIIYTLWQVKTSLLVKREVQEHYNVLLEKLSRLKVDFLDGNHLLSMYQMYK